MTHPPPVLRAAVSELSLRVVRAVTRGGPTSVLQVEAASGARFALKVLGREAQLDPESRLRFERERRVLASLAHPALPPVLASGRTHEGRPFLLTPWIEGETLAERLRRGPLPMSAGLRVVRDVLGALAVAHAAGVVHRDVKPSNVVLARAGGAVLLDFGAASVHGEADLTGDGWVIGTARWLAPEQVLAGRVDERTDVYAAGLVLYEVLVGEYPFASADDVDVVAAHLERTMPRLPSSFPRELARTVARATRKVPAERFGSARSMERALARVEASGALDLRSGATS